MKKTTMISIGVIAVAAVLFLALRAPASNAEGINADIYKEPSCGCCGNFASYLDGKDYAVDIHQMAEVDSMKDKLGVPQNMRSCHTAVIDGYFVEGHIPKEAIDKLITEHPDIKGIAMPGMPSASPGMPGAKEGPFVIYAVHNDGSTEEYMRI